MFPTRLLGHLVIKLSSFRGSNKMSDVNILERAHSFSFAESRRFRFRIRLLRYSLRVLTWRDELNDEFSDYYITVSRIIISEVSNETNREHK